MIVVSYTTPLRYLIEIEAIEILPSLFGQLSSPRPPLLMLGRLSKTSFRVPANIVLRNS